MSDSKASKKNENAGALIKSYRLLGFISICALVATFLVSNSAFTFEIKFGVFVSVVFLYLITCLASYKWQKNELPNILANNSGESFFDDETERKLLVLEEANQFFGATLKSSDMFRLVASRINEIIPFSVLTLYLADKEKSKLKIVYAAGKNVNNLVGIEISSDDNLAGLAFQNIEAQFDEKLHIDKSIVAFAKLDDLKSAIAVPLSRNAEAYGVLVIYADAQKVLNRQSLQLFEAIAARIAPLFLGSRVFEDNLASALTDSLTNLPNERAFYLIMENQIAESHRFREERPLAILAIDIKEFSSLNQRFGHAIGDRLLEYTSEIIKSQLRQMDFLARSSGDEFLAVLPTASEQVASEIIERIEKSFISKPFEIAQQEKINIRLNFGSASFGKDGETTDELLKHSYLRKRQAKNAVTSNILWFPKEYVN